MYDDYYDNYNEFDIQIEEFKLALIKGIKEEHQLEMERLVKENKQLQEIKKNWNKLEREYKNKVREIENEKENVIKNIKREIYQDKLKDFLEKAFETRELYNVTRKLVELDKCDVCDENRKIIVKDIFGREHKVNCKCKDSKKYYVAEESSTQLYIQKSERKNNFWMSLRVGDDSYSSSHIFGFGDIDIQTNGNILNKFDVDNPPNSCYSAYFTNKEEYKEYSKRRWIAIKKAIKLQALQDKKAGLDGQYRFVFNQEKPIIEAFKEVGA